VKTKTNKTRKKQTKGVHCTKQTKNAMKKKKNVAICNSKSTQKSNQLIYNAARSRVR
jgi:hypothetical protein